MGRKPNPLIDVFLNQNVSLPNIHWEMVPPEVDVREAWESFDQNVEGWVPAWFPTYDANKGVSYSERAGLFFQRKLGKNTKGHDSMAPVGFCNPKKSMPLPLLCCSCFAK